MEDVVDGFLEDVLARLDEDGLRTTNLHRLWNDLMTERENPEVARFRRLEAQLGCDPDEVDEDTIRSRLGDAAALGEEALGEVAADAALCGHAFDCMMSASDIMETAGRSGFDADVGDVIALPEEETVPQFESADAWRVGKCMARALRDRNSLDGQPVSDQRLADFAGTTSRAITEIHRRSDGISFALRQQHGHTRISLRSGWKTGRRFELARLIGDRTLGHREASGTR